MRLFGTELQQAWKHKSFFLQKNSPHLLFGAGVIGVIGSTVLACKATLKLDETLLEGKKELARVRAANLEGYSEKDRARDVTVVITKTSMKVVKLYGPSILLGAASIGALTKSHSILAQRNTAITAAYAAVEAAFEKYRERVVTKYGEDVDLELRYGVEEVEEVDEKTGKTKKVKQVALGEPSMYARFFDPTSRSWSKDPEVNNVFIRAHQRYANDLLISRGHVFLNEVYDMLGLDRSTAGAAVGWLHTPDSDRGDNYIDFGLFNADESVRAFMNRQEGSVLLDFNVDGVIWDKIDTPREALSWQNP